MKELIQNPHRVEVERDMTPTMSHRLILPTDANHHGTLYAGSLLRMTLEAAYATAWRHVGADANLVLRRVLNLECLKPVPVGTVIEIQGSVLYQTQTYLITGLYGTPLNPDQGPWMESLFGFAQIDDQGKPALFPNGSVNVELPEGEQWTKLITRMQKLIKIK
jgi:acyl-CoA thioesterase YciA